MIEFVIFGFVFIILSIVLMVGCFHTSKMTSQRIGIIINEAANVSQRLRIAYHKNGEALKRQKTEQEGCEETTNLNLLITELLEEHLKIQTEIEETLNSKSFQTKNKTKDGEDFICNKVSALKQSLDKNQQRLLHLEKAKIHIRDRQLETKVAFAMGSYGSYIEKLNQASTSNPGSNVNVNACRERTAPNKRPSCHCCHHQNNMAQGDFSTVPSRCEEFILPHLNGDYDSKMLFKCYMHQPLS